MIAEDLESTFSPYPLAPSPRAARGEGELFLWGFAGGRSPPAKPPYFFFPPQRRNPTVGEGAKAAAYKGSAIAVELPDARLNNDRTFSFLNDVRQHLASPSKMAPNEHEFHE